jgi:hypothetical protein
MGTLFLWRRDRYCGHQPVHNAQMTGSHLMNKQISILTDIDLDVAAGSSFITQMPAADVQGVASRSAGGAFFQSASLGPPAKPEAAAATITASIIETSRPPQLAASLSDRSIRLSDRHCL